MKLKSIIFIFLLLIILPNIVFSSSNTTNISNIIDDSISPSEAIPRYDMCMPIIEWHETAPEYTKLKDNSTTEFHGSLSELLPDFKKNNSIKNISDNIITFSIGCLYLFFYVMFVILDIIWKYWGIVILIGIIILGGLLCK